MKIKLHSMTDLITNSSTVIYTYSDASEKVLREMINEMFKVLKIDKTCDDVFNLVLTMDDIEYYEYFITDGDEEDDDETIDTDIKELKGLKRGELHDAISKIVQKVVNGKMKKPTWMHDAEQKETGEGFRYGNTLNITPKAPEYAKLAKLIKDFLYSTESESTYG